MLSYKEYKQLNESLYNLGIRSPNIVAGIVSDSQLNGTEAAIEAESEEAIEEAKKAKKCMNKKMDGEMEDVKPSDVEDEVAEDENEDEDSEEESDEDEDSEDEEESEEDEDEESEDDEDEEEPEVKEEPKFMKKRAKKEWSEVLADLESVLEDVSDEAALSEIKKGLQTIKEGVKKSKGHKKGCDCNFCKNIKSKKGEGDKGNEDGLTDKQKDLPPFLKKKIAEKNADKKKDKKSCGKYMKEEEQAWWDSVNSMLGSDVNQKNWDGGWKEVGEVQQAIRENAELKKKVVSEMNGVDFAHPKDSDLANEIENLYSQMDHTNYQKTLAKIKELRKAWKAKYGREWPDYVAG